MWKHNKMPAVSVVDHQDSDYYARSGSTNMPDFRSALREKIKHTRDELPTGLMREVR